MPALEIDNPGVAAVESLRSLLRNLINEAKSVESDPGGEPTLHKSKFPDLKQRVSQCLSQSGAAINANDDAAAAALRLRHHVVVEIAARELFNELVAAVPIDSPDALNIWNFFDLLSMLSDDEQSSEGLAWLLLEELLDSQTIAGCRKIFDYLESRRERLTAKHFKNKHLIILRACNELLRRLSRAEDTAFCGRVFIFLFQISPLGDRSSVNLRGEYHVENVTSYETSLDGGAVKMDVDEKPKPEDSAKAATKDKDSETDTDALYPMFWSLQENFSQPLRLFEADNFSKFRNHLEATIKAFQKYPGDEGSRPVGSADDSKKDLKRKRSPDDEVVQAVAAFNPKYLTSRDLFELEIADLSFRRHILVQALILLDFLLSLSAAAKEKYVAVAAVNRSVLYAADLKEDDTKWVEEMKLRISDYLRPTQNGQYFFRMVDTVLMRDKNWVVWKMAGCPPITRSPVEPEKFVAAMSSIQKTATNKRLRPVPLGSVSLDFLRSSADEDGLESLKEKTRFELPELESFKRKIADDDFEIEMPTNEESKAAAVAGKASKSWRALRVAGRFKLAMFDRIDDPKKIDIIFQDPDEALDEDAEAEPTAAEDDMPSNKEPLIIAGPSSVGKTALVEKLLEQHKGVFAPVVRHAVRDPTETEINGKTFHFVKTPEFNQLRDGDRLVEYGTRDGVDYGTSTKAIEAVTESGKVPVIELDLEAAQFAKDMDFDARYVLVTPPSAEAHMERLRSAGKEDEEAKRIAEAALPDADGLFDVTITTESSLDDSARDLSAFIFKEAVENGDGEGDEAMPDATGAAVSTEDGPSAS